MRSTLTILLVLTAPVLTFAQPSPDTLWTRTYGGSSYDGAHSVQQTADGGYIVAGYTESFGTGLEDFYVVKTNPLGDTLGRALTEGTALMMPLPFGRHPTEAISWRDPPILSVRATVISIL